MRNDEKNAFLFKSYPFYMKYKQNSLFGGHFGRHLEFQYEESTFRLDTQAKKFAHCITVNIQPSNFFSGGGGTKLFFCPIGFCTIGFVTKFQITSIKNCLMLHDHFGTIYSVTFYVQVYNALFCKGQINQEKNAVFMQNVVLNFYGIPTVLHFVLLL